MDKKILVVDDDADLLEMMSVLLTDNNYEVSALSTGDRVFENIAAFCPDLVLMDIMLAGMDGRVICKAIKDNPATSTLPVILISGTHNPRLLHHHGAPNDFIAKPFDLNNFLARVKNQMAA